MLFLITLISWLSNSAFAPKHFAAIDGSVFRSHQIHNKAGFPLPSPTARFHQQGIQALEAGGWAVSGSDADTGYLYFTDPAGSIHTVYRPADKGKKYNHPGGFQITDDILAVGLENTDLRKESYSKIIFLDVREPHSPTPLDHLQINRRQEPGRIMTAGAVGMARMDRHYLVAAANWDSQRIDFYHTVNQSNKEDSALDLMNSDVVMSPCFGSWSAGKESKSYQNINLYPAAKSKTCYLVGMYSVDRKVDVADLWLIDYADPAGIRGEKLMEKQFNGDDSGAHFVQGGGTCFDAASGRFSVFAIDGRLVDGQSKIVSWRGN